MNFLNDTERKIKMRSCRSLKPAKEGKEKQRKKEFFDQRFIYLVKALEKKKVCIHCKTDVTLPSKAFQ